MTHSPFRCHKDKASPGQSWPGSWGGRGPVAIFLNPVLRRQLPPGMTQGRTPGPRSSRLTLTLGTSEGSRPGAVWPRRSASPGGDLAPGTGGTTALVPAAPPCLRGLRAGWQLGSAAASTGSKCQRLQRRWSPRLLAEARHPGATPGPPRGRDGFRREAAGAPDSLLSALCNGLGSRSRRARPKALFQKQQRRPFERGHASDVGHV